MSSRDTTAGQERTALRRLAARGYLPMSAQGVADLCESGLAQSLDDSAIATAAGLAAAGALLLLHPDSDTRLALETCLPDFDALDLRVRRACTQWQLRPDGSANDHGDPAYDQAVRDSIARIHVDALPTLDRLCLALPDLAEYRDLLGQALDEFAAGDDRMLASPVVASYHTVWMWLHQEMRLRLGLPPADQG